MTQIRIVSDGTSHGTKVFVRQGLVDVPIDGVMKIELLPIGPRMRLRARVTFDAPVLDVLADLEKVKQP